VNRLAQIAGCFLLEHPSAVEAFQGKTRRFIKREHERLINRVSEQPAVKVFPSITSFALIKLLNRLDAERVCSAMARQRILLRNCSNFKGLSDRFVRISLKNPEINARVTDKFLELFD
jgi:threonine-phosphate decarboxylase